MTTRAVTLLTLALSAPLLSAQEQPANAGTESTTAPSVAPASPNPETQAPAPAAVPPASVAPAEAAPAAEVSSVPSPSPEVAPVAQTAPAASVAPEPAQPSPAPAEASTTSRNGSGQDTISVDFPEEDIRTILRNVADLFELNLVVPDQLQGKTSIKLRDVTWRQIFQVVLSPVNFTYMEDGNIIRIVSVESLLVEPTVTEVFVLNYARASEIQPTISTLVDPAAGGKIVVEPRANAIVVTERPSRLTRVRPIIESLDRATDQVMIESKFVEVTDKDVRNLGARWDSLKSYKAGVSGINKRVSQNREQDFGNRNQNQNGSSTNNQSTTGNSNDGTSTSSLVSTGSTVTPGTSVTNDSTMTSDTLNRANSNSAMDALSSIAHSGGFASAASAVFSSDDFSVVLSALNELSDTKIVSNPTVVTLNNTEALINVGEEFPIPNYTYNEQRGTFEIQGFTYRPIGIILKVTPQVNNKGFIKLNVEPEVSQRNGEANFNGAVIPIIASRKAKTQVSLKDGYTMGLGGMIKKQVIDAQTKVPFLGDIPIIGNAFKHKNKDSDTTNLLIFITAKVVNSDGASIQQVFSQSQLKEVKLTQQDLPGRRDVNATLPLAPVQEKSKKRPFFRNTRTESKDQSN